MQLSPQSLWWQLQLLPIYLFSKRRKGREKKGMLFPFEVMTQNAKHMKFISHYSSQNMVIWVYMGCKIFISITEVSIIKIKEKWILWRKLATSIIITEHSIETEKWKNRNVSLNFLRLLGSRVQISGQSDSTGQVLNYYFIFLHYDILFYPNQELYFIGHGGACL